LNTTPDKSTESDSAPWAFALLGAFLAGAMITLIAALAARNEGLRRQLDQRPVTPAVVVVKGGAL